MELDINQEKIANDFEGEIAVVAGPGSGKTRTLIERTERINNSINNPQKILLISYTNKVRSEIKRRLKEKNSVLEAVNVHTFHSLGVALLRRYGSFVGVNNNFEIIDDEDAKSILNRLYEEIGIRKSDFPIKNMLKEIRDLYKKKQSIYVDSRYFIKYLESLTPETKYETIFDYVFNYYTYYKRNNHYLDFEDIIVYMNALLYVENAKKIIDNFEYVMVDEAQDLDTRQYELINMLKTNGVKNILLVGDFDQNIYSWRGARTDLFKAFYTEAKKYSLGFNYRSVPSIVNNSRKLIEHNSNRIDINLVSNQNDNGFRPVCNTFNCNSEEFEWVTSNIKKLLSSGTEPSEIAILYRANYLSRGIESELVKNNIKYVVYNGFEFYQRKEIKDCICLLKLIINRDNKVALERILGNFDGIGPKKISYILGGQLNHLSENDKARVEGFNTLLDEADKKKLISAKLEFLIDSLGYQKIWDDGNLEDRLENYSELLRFIETFDNELMGLKDFLDSISLLNKRDEQSNVNECIKLMTLHSCKGLEFKYVFIISALEDIIPNQRSIQEGLTEEERRLMYVGITRAKEAFFITASPIYGYTSIYNSISRFVNEANISIRKNGTSMFGNNTSQFSSNFNRQPVKESGSNTAIIVAIVVIIFIIILIGLL